MKCECNYHLGLGPNLKCPVHGKQTAKLLIDKEPDREIYFSFDRRCHDVNELKEIFSLIGYEVRTHGAETEGYQDHFFLEPCAS